MHQPCFNDSLFPLRYAGSLRELDSSSDLCSEKVAFCVDVPTRGQLHMIEASTSWLPCPCVVSFASLNRKKSKFAAKPWRFMKHDGRIDSSSFDFTFICFTILLIMIVR